MKRFGIIFIMAVFSVMLSFNTAEAKKTETIKKLDNEVISNTSANEYPNLDTIGFHKRTELSPEIQIKKIFQDYEKYTNSKNIDGFLKLHDKNYRSADGYDISRLKQIALESWKDYPHLKHTVKIVSINVNIDNATVITNEKLSGITETNIDYVRGNGEIDSESTAIYYLQRFSNDWKIVSDFIISEKTAMRFGVAKFIPMHLDAPAIASSNEDYTAIIKIAVPNDYVALVSLTNEPITYPAEKSTEVFRGLKADGVRERILKTNNNSKNENAIASIAIAQPDIKNDMVNINIAGVAFLSTRVNVVKHKIDTDNIISSIKADVTIGNKIIDNEESKN